jgi:O-methyltransferase
MTDIQRPDVTSRDASAPQTSGFRFDFPFAESSDRIAEISIVARADNGRSFELTKRMFPSPSCCRSAFTAAAKSATKSLGPLPRPIMSLVEDLNLPLAEASAGYDRHDRLVEQVRLACLMMPLVEASPELANYIRFLRSCWNHFLFVAQYFPTTNSGRSSDAKDWNCKQNSPEEMVSIAHHLFVLKSYDISGDFAEFGCFKGYSSAMLSYACSLLGIRMHIFDSFEGLPPSDSKYYKAGDFLGSAAEVARNLRIFGSFEAVDMHQGFFKDSVESIGDEIGQLVTIWMDVDLASSARDVLKIGKKLHHAGAVFSHESPAQFFNQGKVVSFPPSPDNVVGPIADYFGAEKVAGRHVVNDTGAFWRQNGGIEVLSNKALMTLLKVF